MADTGRVDWKRFGSVWILSAALYLLAAAFWFNGLNDAGFWPRVNQHRLQLQAWLGEDIVLPIEDGTGIGTLRVDPRLDITPYVVHTAMLDPREAALTSNLAAVMPESGRETGPPWRPVQDSAEATGSRTATAYVGMPLGPVLLLAPFEPLMGGGGGAQWVSALVAGLAVAGLDALTPLWLGLLASGGAVTRHLPRAEVLVVAAAGSGLALAAPDGGSPMFAHVAAVACLTLGLLAAARGRPVPAGLGWGLAIVCRPPTLLAAPLVVALLLRARSRERGPAPALVGLAGFPALLVGAHAVLNQLRFGSPFDFGYAYMLTPPWLLERMRELGQLSFHHLPRNLWYLFLQPPVPVVEGASGRLAFPFLASDPMGMGLLFVTPAALAALATVLPAVRRSRLVAWCWLALGATAVPALLYFNTGWVQWGGRFLLDGWPMGMLLIAAGMAALPRAVGAVLAAASVATVGWGAAAILAGAWPACCM